jgi:hypothetical protein
MNQTRTQISALSVTDTKCRCGWNGEGDHPCHYGAYTCGKPATQRFYNARPVCLAGAQLKFGVMETWACDDHWAEWQSDIKEVKA